MPFIYDTNVLIQTVPNLKRPTKFLLDRYFPGIVNADSEYVSIDVEVRKRRMTPFCSPLVEGKLVEQLGYLTNTFKPPYCKDKRAPDLRKPVRRMIGERIGGDLTPEEREMANINFELTDQIDCLDRRSEWMAASALATGSVTVQGNGFPTTVINFGRDASLTVAKTGTSKWTPANVAAGNASPVSDIEEWQRDILKKSGATCTDIVFTTSSWKGFIADPLLKGAIYYPKLGESGTINIGSQIQRGAVYKGRWGQYDLWEYNEWFVIDESTEGDGTKDKEYPMLVDGTVVMCGADLMGTRAYAQILDPAFNYQSLTYAPKTWVKEDPAQRFLLLQSAPVVIPTRVNACVGANVCDPVFT